MEQRKTELTTVVIPNYNGMAYVENCLKSLYAGSRIPRIIVVDNASKDGSDRLVREKFPEAELISFSENKGFSAAVNAGIRAAGTPYVFLLNNDTTTDPLCIEHLEEAMGKEKNCFSMEAKMIQMWEPDRLDGAGDYYCLLGWAFARGKDQAPEKYRKRDRIFSACAGAAIYRKDLLEKTGLFDEVHFAYLEDVDIGYRANLHGYRNLFVPDAIVYHAGSAVSGSRHNPFKVELTARNNLYLIYKNMPLLQLLINLPFLLLGILIKGIYFGRKGMGKSYLSGLKKGLFLCASKEGRAQKLHFQGKWLPYYLWTEWELILNTVRRL